MSKKLRLQTTDGRHIIGTLERLYGCAYIDEASVYLDDGRVELDLGLRAGSLNPQTLLETVP